MEFIREFSAKKGFPPSIRDIGDAVKLSSSCTVHHHLTKLEEACYIRRDPRKPRSIELVETEDYRAVTLLGSPDQFQELLELLPPSLGNFRNQIQHVFRSVLNDPEKTAQEIAPTDRS